MDEFLNRIRKEITLSQEAEDYLLSISEIKHVSKGEILIQQGHRINKTFYVIEGCLRSFCMDTSGKEHTLQFAIKDWWISDFIALYEKQTANLTVECLNDSKIIEFNFQKLHHIYNLFPEFEAMQRNNLERHVVSLHK